MQKLSNVSSFFCVVFSQQQQQLLHICSSHSLTSSSSNKPTQLQYLQLIFIYILKAETTTNDMFDFVIIHLISPYVNHKDIASLQYVCKYIYSECTAFWKDECKLSYLSRVQEVFRFANSDADLYKLFRYLFVVVVVFFVLQFGCCWFI